MNIPSNKRIVIALTYIYGIGPYNAKEICKKHSSIVAKRVKDLSDENKTSQGGN